MPKDSTPSKFGVAQFVKHTSECAHAGFVQRQVPAGSVNSAQECKHQLFEGKIFLLRGMHVGGLPRRGRNFGYHAGQTR